MNDAFGHEDGDKLIILISKEIKKSIQKTASYLDLVVMSL